MPRISRAQKRFNNDGLTFAIDIDELLDALAAGASLSQNAHDPRYLDAIVDEAFEKADNTFNVAAAAYGQTGAISHMYEWGTSGINKGRTNVRLDPMSPAARLWTNFSEGRGLDRTLWFAYRPSVANVPKPTVGATGMSSEVINKMRDHVFRWKAEAMEEGQTVHISRKKAKFLLVPAYKQNRRYMRPHDVKRGYALYRYPMSANPGRQFYGNFSSFWTEFWAGEGVEIIETYTNEMMIADYEPEFRAKRTTKTLRPVGTFDVKTEVAKRSKKISSRVTAKARARRTSK